MSAAVSSQALPRLAVTGLGAACLKAVDSAALWQRLLTRDAGLSENAPFDSSQMRCRRNTIADSEAILNRLRRDRPDLADGIPDHAPRALLHGLAAASEALEMAELVSEGSGEAGPRIGLSLGTTSGSGFDAFCEADGNAALAPMAEPNAAITHVARALGLTGPVSQISNACTSSAAAIAHGVGMILSGRADAVIVGGADHARAADFAGFNALRAMSSDCCRAFDRDRDGMIIGDGAAMLVIETEDAARARGAHILAHLDGFGLSSDAFHSTKPRPDGMERAIRHALTMSGRDPASIGYVNCHGTGTPANDVTEAEALSRVFEGADAPPVLSSTKTVTGHLLGSAAALEAVITVLILRAGLVPQMAHSEQADPEIRLPLALGRSVPLDRRSAMSTTLGFGGSNACLLFSLPDDFERAA